MTVPIGDILMVSQVAWKIGRAFSAGRKDAPAEFQEVETEIGGLATALKLLAETLHAESEKSMFHSADKEIQDENVVASMAERVDSMYHSSSNLDQELDEINRIVQDLSMNNVAPPPVPTRNPTRSTTAEGANPLGPTLTPSRPSSSSIRRQNTKITPPRPHQRPKSPQQPLSSGPSSTVAPSYPTETTSTSRATSPSRKLVSEFSFGGTSLRYSSSSYASSDAGTSSAGWPSPGPLRESSISRQSSTSTKKKTPLPRTPEVREPGEHIHSGHLSLLPPPAMGLSTQYELETVASRSSHTRSSPYPSTQPDIMKLHRSSTTASQKAAFEKEAFRNSAILCDIRGQLVEYSHQINEDDPKDVEMIQASEECRIAVVRKRVHDSETKSMRLVTSIWAFSDDGTVRVELRMHDDHMFIPYSSYFSPNKISITVPCELKFHDVKFGNRPAKTAKTSWVNYIFDTPQDAALFQNELMGRTLLATFRTEKTMRIHEGLGKSFSYAEQMCGLENLRVWEDNDTGAIVALIHFSADFRNGYLAFYINSSTYPIKVKDDGHREVKIKGLRVPIDRGDRAMRKDSLVADGGKGKGKDSEAGKKIGKVEKEKVISGAKIEFASDMERKEFLEMVKEMQKDMIELPDLLGVN
ncbi:Nn.00g067970.m01.CDS01 [Neocucurbitaria sp. VM-36]